MLFSLLWKWGHVTYAIWQEAHVPRNGGGMKCVNSEDSRKHIRQVDIR